MSSIPWVRVRELFASAVELPPLEQTTFLANECGDDDALRERVRQLLEADTRSQGKITPLDELDRGFEPARKLDYVGRSVGEYEIIRVIGQGGMGVVFEARQPQPQRSVALKMMSSPLVTDTERARFEFEIETLGRLQHPGIAQVFDAGSWHDQATGRTLPWFAMELIADGQPLDCYAKDHDLDVRERVALVRAVAAAVQHGHAHGILHRDLKPDNILVDAAGQPKVIDFGTARSLDTAVARFTVTGMMLGTPAYMSPEQFEGEPNAIDAQSDVYALGVILYQLLADRLPLDPAADAWTKFAERVRREQPVRLSACRTGAAWGGLEEDLDWICTTALAKDRSERYASVAQMHDDLRRFLAGEPVTAGPPSTVRAVRRFVRHNRLLVGAVASVFSVLVIGIITTTWWMLRAEEQSALKDAQKHLAERAATRAATINEFYGGILKIGDPREGRNESRPDWTVREAIEASSEWIDKLEAEPDVEASVRLIAGNALSSFRAFDQARAHFQGTIELLERAGHPSSELADALTGLANIHLRIHTAANSQAAGAPEALALFRRAREVLLGVHGEQHERVAQNQMQIGGVLRTLGKLDDASLAIDHARRIYELLPGEHRRFIAICMSHQADVATRRHDFEASRELYRQAIALLEAAKMGQHPAAGSMHELLGSLLVLKLNEREGGLSHYESAAEIFAKALGEDSLECARVSLKAVNQLAMLGRNDDLEKYLRRAERGYSKLDPATAPRLINVRHRLAQELRARGAYVEGRDVLAKVQGVVDSTKLDAVKIRGMHRDYARCVRDAGNPGGAEKLFRAQLEGLEEPRSREGLMLRIELAKTAVGLGDLAAADRQLAEVVRDSAALSKQDLIHGLIHDARAARLLASNEFTAAETELLAARDVLVRVAGARHCLVREALFALVKLGEKSGDAAKANGYRAELAPPR